MLDMNATVGVAETAFTDSFEALSISSRQSDSASSQSTLSMQVISPELKALLEGTGQNWQHIIQELLDFTSIQQRFRNGNQRMPFGRSSKRSWLRRYSKRRHSPSSDIMSNRPCDEDTEHSLDALARTLTQSGAFIDDDSICPLEDATRTHLQPVSVRNGYKRGWGWNISRKDKPRRRRLFHRATARGIQRSPVGITERTPSPTSH